MDNRDIDEDNIPLLHPDPDDNYDYYKTPNTSRDPEDTPFTAPGFTEKETTLT